MIKSIEILNHETPLNPQNDNVDVRIELNNGEVYIPTFFTLKNVESLMKKWSESGENKGTYFCVNEPIIVETLDEATIIEAVIDMVNNGNIDCLENRSPYRLTYTDLKMSKQKNVQQQNTEQKQHILAEATHWRENGVPKPIVEVFKNYHIDMTTSIIFDYIDDGYGIENGMIVTADGQFYEFDIELNANKTELITLHGMDNITEFIEINAHKKGTGKTLGFIAMEVLAELNGLNY